jgi:hypothetical protein
LTSALPAPRPYLLRKPDRDNQYLYSIEAAIESAKSDLLGRREFQFQKPVDLKVNSGGYRVWVSVRWEVLIG